MKFLFIPGINNTASTWTATRDALARLGYESEAISCPAINDINELAASLKPNNDEKYIVVGHSFGGMVSMAFIAQFAEQTEGLVLVNTIDNSDSEELAATRREKAQQALDGKYLEFAKAATANAFHPESLKSADIMQAREAEVEAYGAERFAAHQVAMSKRPNRRALLAAYNKPKLVVAADNDVVIPTAMQKIMADEIDAEYQEIPATGHMLPAEAPQQLANILANWAKRSF